RSSAASSWRPRLRVYDSDRPTTLHLSHHRHSDVTEGGNFEGHNILNRLQRPPSDTATEDHLATLRAKLLAAREPRVRPGLDDKVLADWNGLMIAGLVNAGLLLDEPGWVETARRAFDFIAREMTPG